MRLMAKTCIFVSFGIDFIGVDEQEDKDSGNNATLDGTKAFNGKKNVFWKKITFDKTFFFL